jgi:hypothetical protein
VDDGGVSKIAFFAAVRVENGAIKKAFGRVFELIIMSLPSTVSHINKIYSISMSTAISNFLTTGIKYKIH